MSLQWKEEREGITAWLTIPDPRTPEMTQPDPSPLYRIMRSTQTGKCSIIAYEDHGSHTVNTMLLEDAGSLEEAQAKCEEDYAKKKAAAAPA
jgi:hypothetical protein